MMNKKKIAKAMPTVLFVVGIVGIFVSEVMVARDTVKAKEELDQDIELPEGTAINDEGIVVVASKPKYAISVVKKTWKCFMPSAVSTTLTLTALLTSRHLTKKEIALLSSAAVSGASLVQRYRREILDRTDEDTLRDIDTAVANACLKERKPVTITTSHMVSGETFDPNEDGEYLFFDPLTNMKFRATKLMVNSARYYLNRNFALGGDVDLGMFYGFLGLDIPEEYKCLEWDVDEMVTGGHNTWIDVDFTRSTTPDPETGEYYYIIEYDYYPGELEDGPYTYPFGNPLISEGSVAI